MATSAKKDVPSLSDLVSDKNNKNTNTEVKDQPEGDQNQNQSPEVKDNDQRDLPIGPDSDKEDVLVDVPDSTEPYIADNVTALRTNKTPAELAAESPDETAERYGISTEISDEDADNPRVQAYRDTLVNQVPSGTHLHPDIAKDFQNRGVAEQHTDNAQVKRTITDTYDFAPDAETNDKF
jgi:hypothetical protein